MAPPISKAINDNNIVAASVLSGNRNFEGRVSPDVRANFLASPPLVVAYAMKGTVTEDLVHDPIGQDQQGADVFLKDIWPTNAEVRQFVDDNVDRSMFERRYAQVYQGDERWRGIQVEGSDTYKWRAGSTYIANPPYFEGMGMQPDPVADIVDAKLLALLGDSITTDHISPAGSIKADSPAGQYLMEHQVSRDQFNSYGSRRGNHEVMMRGTFANIRIRNEMTPGVEGGVTRYDGEVMPIYDAAMRHKADGTPLVVVAGKEYGTGSSRDWAAKGTLLLGRARGDHRELRAHPPVQPDRHGRPAAPVRAGRHPHDVGHGRRRDLHHPRRRRDPGAPDGAGGDDPAGWLDRDLRDGDPHRYGERAGVLSERRYPAICAEEPGTRRLMGPANVAALALAIAVGGCAVTASETAPAGRYGRLGEPSAAPGCPVRAQDRSCVALADLNDDGVPEVLVYAADPGRCGSGGCVLLVLAQEGARWGVVAATTVSRLPIYRLATHTNGWSDLGVTIGGGGAAPGVARLRFDGARYPQNPTVEPLVTDETELEPLLFDGAR